MMAVSKRVIIPVRVPEDVAQAIDKVRAGQSRSSWVTGAIDAALREAKRESGPPPPEVISEAIVPLEGGKKQHCPHPRARVIKGFCYRCGKPVT